MDRSCLRLVGQDDGAFCEHHDEKYAAIYGRYRLERIRQIGERFSLCGDYLQGVARIRCTNPEWGHDYFRPFSRKGFYLCPSCSRKCAILFAALTQHVPPKGGFTNQWYVDALKTSWTFGSIFVSSWTRTISVPEPTIGSVIFPGGGR